MMPLTGKQLKQRGRWLIAALRQDRVERALELIGQGADVSVRGPGGETALYTALAYAHYRLVPALLEAGADPNVPGPDETYPIHLAAQFGDDEAPALLELLLRHGARIDVRDDEGSTAMFLAGKHACAEAVHTLLRHGANISDRNAVLDTALNFACCWGMTERAAMLLDAGIDLHAQDDLGMNALAWAAKGGHVETVTLLLRLGAQVNVPDRWGQTPLIRAAQIGSRRCVELLLEAGADPRARDESGQTALDHARRYAGRDLVEALQAEEHVSGHPGPITVERTTTDSGEAAVCVVAHWENGGGWSMERIDGFDAIVEMLQRRVGTTDPD